MATGKPSGSSNGRKRSRPSFLLEDNTPSDPALFSSDPVDPGVEHYFAQRPKKQYRGHWWQDEKQRKKRAFERNKDSGVFMASDDTLDPEPIESNSDDTAADDLLEEDENEIIPSSSSMAHRPVRISEPPGVILARRRIAQYAENGFIPDPDGVSHTSQYSVDYRGPEEVPCELPLDHLGLTHLTDDMIAPLQNMVKAPHWETRRSKGQNLRHNEAATDASIYSQSSFEESESDDECSLNSEIDLVRLDPEIAINIASNALTDLPLSLFTVPGLVQIQAPCNNITSISPHIWKCVNLEVLDVRSNRLRWLPAEVADLIQDTKVNKFVLNAKQNPFVQPFLYTGFYKNLRSAIPGCADTWDERQVYNLVPRSIPEVRRRIELISEGWNNQNKDEKMQQRWLLRLYEHFVALPELLWLDLMNTQEDWKPDEEELQMFITRWGAGGTCDDEDADQVRADFLGAKAKLNTRWGQAVRHTTILMAATPISYLDIAGQPKNPRIPRPSDLPMDQTVVSARLLKVPVRDLDTVPGCRIFDHGRLNVSRQAKPSSAAPYVRSLFSLCLRSASTVSELKQLPELLPDDVSPSVHDGLQIAIRAQDDGGRLCSTCKRHFIVPRAEWLEYHYIHNLRSHRGRIENMFTPFLRTVCSWACVPQFDYDE